MTDQSLSPACCLPFTPSFPLPPPDQVFLREASAVSPLSLMLLGSSLQVLHEAGAVLVDGWLQLRVPAVSAVLIKRLRQALEWVLEDAVAAAGGGGGGKRAGGGLLGRQAQAVMAVLQQLLAAEGR